MQDRWEVFCKNYGDGAVRCEPLIGGARNAARQIATSQGTELVPERARWQRARLYHVMRQVGCWLNLC